MAAFKRGDNVFPKWSQVLPAFTVVAVGVIMVTVVDEWGNKEVMHKDDLVMQDPNRKYDRPQYAELG